MFRASHLLYAMATLISVFLIAIFAAPSSAEGVPLSTTIVACDPERLDRPCAAPGGDVLVGGEVRVS